MYVQLEAAYVAALEEQTIGAFDASVARAYNRSFAELASQAAGTMHDPSIEFTGLTSVARAYDRSPAELASQAAGALLQTVCCRSSVADCLLQAWLQSVCCRLTVADCLLQTVAPYVSPHARCCCSLELLSARRQGGQGAHLQFRQFGQPGSKYQQLSGP